MQLSSRKALGSGLDELEVYMWRWTTSTLLGSVFGVCHEKEPEIVVSMPQRHTTITKTHW
jgi:hypothetical protein